MNAAPTRQRELFDRARQLDADAQRLLLDAECPDPAMRAELEALLAAARDPHDPLASRIADAARETLAGNDNVTLGAYRLLEPVGEGGMGIVWRALRRDGEFQRQVAIKILRGVPHDHARERLRRERQLLADLEHPNIARLYDGGTTPRGEPFLVMEFVAGLPLDRWLRDVRPDLRTRLALFAVLCRAVHHAHQHLVVHCDLKPGNVVVRDDGTPVLLDFGIARLIEPGHDAARTATFAATPAYASPEQLLGRPVTVATDVFGLGMVLYELLAGRVPERRRDAIALSQELPAPSRLAREAPDPALAAARIPADLDRVVRRAVRSEPQARYASAAALAEDVQAWLDGRPVAPADAPWRYVLGKFVRRHRFAVALGALALAAVTGLALLFAWQSVLARQALARAEREASAARESVAFLRSLFSELDPRINPGRTFDARVLLDLGRSRLQRATDLTPQARADLQLTLAGLYANSGRPRQALELAGEAEASMAQQAPDDGTRTALHLLKASASLPLSQFDQAKQEADRALALARAREDRLQQAAALNVLGELARELNRPVEARRDFEQAQALYAAAGARGADGVTQQQHSLAQLAESGGDFPTALRLYQAAHETRAARLGPDHPDTLASQYGIALVLNFLGRTEESIARYQDLLARSRRVFGDSSAATELAVGGLGTAQRRAGDYVAAEASYREALRLRRELAGGADSANEANHLSNLARLRQELGDIDQSEALNNQATIMRRSLFGENSPMLALSLQNRSDYRFDRGDIEGARVANEEALRIRRAVFPPGHFLLLISEASAIEIDVARGALDTASARATALRQALRATPPPPFNTLLVGWRVLAAERLARGDASGALADHDREIALLRERHPPDHVLVAEARWRRAQALAAAGRAGEAARERAAAGRIIVERHVPASPLRQQVERELALRPSPP